ncbi:MAG TPA: acyl carrier protein [Methylocella sp.]|nr:acyl carrier protein [Methylocella sp.]
MTEFPIEQMYRIMRDVLMLHEFEFNTSMSAKDVPGWDSLNHSILMMELSNATGLELSGEETAKLGTVGELHAFITRQMKARHV